MVQESRSLLIQQLLQGGFKEEDDEDEDDDESYEPTKRHSKWINKVAKDDATKKQVVLDIENNAITKQNLLMSTPLKDAKVDLQNSIENCLLPEQEIIRKGSKKLLQIHNDFLTQKYQPIQHFKELVPKCETTKQDNKYFSKTLCMVQNEKLKEEEGFTLLPNSTNLISTSNKDNYIGKIGEAQQSYGSSISGQHILHFNALAESITTEASLAKDIYKKSCFVGLKFTKKTPKELNVSIPNYLTSFENKSSTSGCTMSLAIDQGSSTKSVNGGDEFTQDVMSIDKTMKFNELDMPKGSHFDVLQSSKDKRIVKPTVYIAEAKDFVHMPEQVEIVATQIETTKSSKNHKLDFIDRTTGCEIETSIEYKPTETKNLIFHIPKENHVDFSAEIHKTDKEFQLQDVLSPTENSICNIEMAQLIESSPKTHTNVTLHTYLNKEKNYGDDQVLIGNNFEDRRSFEKIDGLEKEKIDISSSTMSSSKKQLIDIVNLNTVCSTCNKCETLKYTSSKRKLNSHSIKATKTPSDEGPVCDTNFLLKPLPQEVYMGPEDIPIQKETLQANIRNVLLKHCEVTPTTSSSLNCHSAFPVQEIPSYKDQSKWFLDSKPIQALETIPVELIIPVTNSMPAQLHSPNANSPLILSKATPKIDIIAAPTSIKCKAEKFCTTSLNVNSTGKVNTSEQKSKKKICMHQDARTMVFVRSDTQVAYNGPHFAHLDLPLPQDVTQQNTMTNVFNPSLYNFANTQSSQVFMHQEIDKHLLQAQTSAQEAMVAATSALAQSHYKWSQMQNQYFCTKNNQATCSHLSIMREAQIASIATSVAAAAVVAKAAVEAARAIQEASKGTFGQLGCSSQSNFDQNGFARSSELENLKTIKNIGRKKKKKKKKKKKAFLAFKDEINTSNKIHHCLSHLELKDQGAANVLFEPPSKVKVLKHLIQFDKKRFEVINNIDGASSGDGSQEVVEVMTEEVALQGGWFIAKVLMKTDKEAFVQYNELFRDDGYTPCRSLFPLTPIREEDAYRRVQHSNQRWLRPMHPFSKSWKRCYNSMLPQTWTIGKHVDAYSKGGWWEGIIVEIDKTNNTNITIHFPGEKRIEVVKTWDVRPSLIWTGDDWRPWNETSIKEDGTSSKRLKLDSDNVKTKKKEQIVKDDSLKEPIDDCKSISCTTRLPMSLQKNARKVLAINLGRKKCDKQTTKPSCNLETSKKAINCPSSKLLAIRTRTISTRLQLKIEAEKHINLKNLVASKKCVKTISTRSDTIKLKPKAIQTKLLKAFKKTSHKKNSCFLQKCMQN